MKTLETFNGKWLLNINFKKNKILIFQKSGRKPKDISFCINNNPLEIVQEYTYLGIKVTASGNFYLCQKTLVEKALNTVFKIRRQINFCQLSLRSANKIFDTAIQPILTYSSEVWGLYAKLNFDNWDNTPMEKTHLKF